MEGFDPVREPDKAFVFVFLQLFRLAKGRKAVVFAQLRFRQYREADALQKFCFPEFLFIPKVGLVDTGGQYLGYQFFQ